MMQKPLRCLMTLIYSRSIVKNKTLIYMALIILYFMTSFQPSIPFFMLRQGEVLKLNSINPLVERRLKNHQLYSIRIVGERYHFPS